MSVERSFDSTAVQPEAAARRRAGASVRRKLVLLSCVAFVAAGAAGYWRWSAEWGLERARRAADEGDWKLARDHLTSYLGWRPNDSAAHMLMAEALVKDDAGEPRDSVQRAIQHLQQIGDDAPLAAEARLQEARLTLLILQQPARAERLLRDSLRLAPDSYEANLLLWKVLDLTGRHVVSHPFFWRVYELAPESQRSLRLRDWFLAEFYPETANDPFHRALGATQIGQIPASVNLLVRFRESEPDAAFVHAALAAYYLEGGRPKSSLELLKEAPDLAGAMEDAFFVAVLFEVLVELGEFERATACFDRFPPPHAGYLYWRAEGLFRQQVLDDAAAAVRSYERALDTCSAKFDWGLLMRLAECFRKIGRLDEAEAVQSRVKYLTTKVLTREKTSGLREKLSNLGDPDVAREIRDLYQEFGLAREAAEWERHRQRLMRFSQSSIH